MVGPVKGGYSVFAAPSSDARQAQVHPQPRGLRGEDVASRVCASLVNHALRCARRPGLDELRKHCN